MANVLILLWLAVSVLFLIAAIKPKFFHRFGKTPSRIHMLPALGVIGFALLMGVGAASPQNASTQTQPSSTNAAQHQTTKTVTSTKSVPFTSQNVNDGTLPQGQTKVQQAGKDGVETITYRVTYTNGTETSRTQISDAVTMQPTPQITDVGTYVAPPPSSDTGLSNDNTYTNSDGNTVHSPAYSTDGSVPAGATARCADGTYSFSQHHSGTCSYHGGVAEWLD